MKKFTLPLLVFALAACQAQSDASVQSCAVMGDTSTLGESGEIMSVMGLTVLTDAANIDCTTKPVCTVDGNGTFFMQAEYLGKGKQYYRASNKAKVFVKRGEIVCHQI